MSHLMGIDLGTSSAKVIIIDFNGDVKSVASQTYSIETSQPGYAEQNPETWWTAVINAVQRALDEAGKPPIHAIGLAGQMHGTVLLDSGGNILSPAIIWADQRSTQEVSDIIDLIGGDSLERITGTLPAVGFMSATLLWIKRNRTDILDKAHCVLLPKDYVRYRLTGDLATDISDASASALFDINRRCWSSDIIQRLSLPFDIFPEVLGSSEIAGMLSAESAHLLGIRQGIPVVTGCADQVAQAIAGGLLETDKASATIGTGVQYFQPLESPQSFKNLHTFCHALPDYWYVLGAMLSGGLSLKWLRDVLQVSTFGELENRANSVPAGSESLVFLPYLIGERAPVRDANASGVFVGLTLRHHAGHLARATMEGVAFSLRQIIEIVEQEITTPTTLIAVGNGMRSNVWRQIVANVLNRPLELQSDVEQTALGAAYLAGLGTDVYRRWSEIPLSAKTETHDITVPDLALVKRYEDQFAVFREIYPTMVHTMHRLRLTY